MVLHAYNSSPWEMEAGGSEIQGHLQLCPGDMSQKKDKLAF